MAGGWRDASIGKPLVGWKGLEQGHNALEEVGHLFGGLVVGVAGRVQSRHAGAVLAPLVLPERLCRARVGGPVRVHVVQKIRLAIRLKDGGDVGVGTAAITVGFIRAIAVVGLIKC